MAELVKIPEDKLESQVGKPVHLSWARPGAVWILKGFAVDMESVILVEGYKPGYVAILDTPKTHKRRFEPVENLLYARRQEPQVEYRSQEAVSLEHMPCVLCKQTLVWVGGGFDTCHECLAKQ